MQERQRVGRGGSDVWGGFTCRTGWRGVSYVCGTWVGGLDRDGVGVDARLG